MFVILAIFLGLTIGFIRGGSFKSLFTTKLKLWPLGLIGVLIQIGLHFVYRFSLVSSYIPIVNFVSYVLILVTIVFNLKHVWSILTIIGTTANFVVSFINGGKMPVSESVLSNVSQALAESVVKGSNGIYVMMNTASTKLWFLGDYVHIPKIGVITSLYGTVPAISIGSVLVFIGLVGWIQSRMVSGNKKSPKETFWDNEVEDTSSNDAFLEDLNRSNLDEVFLNHEKENDLFMDVDTSHSAGSIADYDPVPDEELTEVIPRLTPELIRQIRQNALDTQDAVFSIHDTETKVFTAINDLDEDASNDVAEESQMDHFGYGSDSDDLAEDFGEFPLEDFSIDKNGNNSVSPSWVKWREKKDDEIVSKEDLESEQTVVPLRREIGKVVDFTEEEINQLPKKNVWDPAEVERNIYTSKHINSRAQTNNPYSTLFNKGVNAQPISKGHSEAEMRDIWHQLSITSQDGKRSGKQVDEIKDLVESDESVQNSASGDESTQKQVKKRSDDVFEEARDIMAKKWDENNPLADIPVVDQTITDRVDSREELRRSLSEKDRKKSQEGLISSERERAGFEKVEMQIDGKNISFWRKKKE